MQSNMNLSRIWALEANDITVYPFTFERSCSLIDVQQDFNHVLPEVHNKVIDLRLCGRVTGIRLVDGNVLCYIEDQHAQLQLTLEANEVGSEGVADFHANICIGDYVGVSVYKVRRTTESELTASIYHWVMLAFTQQPTTDGPCDSSVGTLLAVRHKLMLRSKLVRSIRRCLEDWYGFLEVSLPCASIGSEVSVSTQAEPEEKLLQLVGNGFETVYQLVTHQDSATATERLYACMALSDQNDMMGLTERLFRELALELKDRRVLPWLPQSQLQINGACMSEPARPDEHDFPLMIDLETTWQQRGFHELLVEFTGIDFRLIASGEEAAQVAHGLGVEMDTHDSASGVSNIALVVFQQLVMPKLIQPTFVVNFPATPCPQTPQNPLTNHHIMCTRLFINGLEFAKTNTVVADPRRVERSADHERYPGGASSMTPMRRYGLPQTSSLTMDIDRLAMLFTGTLDIREVRFFPNTMP